MDIPEIVQEFVLKHCKRMPETQQEIDQYLDLINHAKDYQSAVVISNIMSKKMFKKLGFKTPEQIRQDGKELFIKINKTNG